MAKVIIVGAGAAGMLASIFLAKAGHEVKVFEKNEKPGKKLYITGKGRCNVTNAGSREDLISSVMGNKKFMYSAFGQFDNWDMIDFLNGIGVETKIERGNRVFPVTDKAITVISKLENQMKKYHVDMYFHSRVEKLLKEEAKVCGIALENGKKHFADAVLVATGGLSYPVTGSDGDGYRFAKDFGIESTELYPSLVPFNVREDYSRELMGLSLKNVSLSIWKDGKCLYEEFGEMMFTHFGITGPLVLTASANVGPILKRQELKSYIDLKPAVTKEQLDARILKIFDENKNKYFKNIIGGILPSKLEPVIISLSGINPDKKANEITKKERESFIQVMKNFPLTLTGLREFKEAIITKGGISLKEIQPKTFESKKVKGLFFIGEVLDIDCLTGGFNLQVAWSSAVAAANYLNNNEAKFE
ncbi:MAG TPA: NAD(P)/FAD-dependent oxidoreductase [Lachnospiraceae bacterium]